MISLDMRWVKILHDLWLYKSRTIIVIAAITVGVATIGMVNTAKTVFLENYITQYQDSVAAHARISTSPFGETLLRSIQKLSVVKTVEARHVFNGRLSLNDGAELVIHMTAIPDFNAIHIDKVVPMPGAQIPPPRRTILLERSIQGKHNIKIGDTVSVRTPDGKYHELAVAGFVLDPNVMPASITSEVSGYVNFETSFWLEQDEKGVFNSTEHQTYNELLVRTNVENNNKADIDAAITQLKRDMNRLDPTVVVSSSVVPIAGKPTLQDNLDAIWIVLSLAGTAALLLSGFLVTNIMTALLSQQIRQIGVMKAIGGRTNQIIGLYLGMSTVFGGTALLLAIPLGYLGGYGVSRFLGQILNTDLNTFYLPLSVILLQAVTALLVPAIATVLPAFGGTRMTARDAMYSSDNGASTSSGIIGRVLAPLSAWSMPVALSLRNVFRKPLRLALTLVALSLGGAAFIGILGTRDALNRGFDDIIAENDYNIQITFQVDKDTLLSEVERDVRAVDGVVGVESWKTTTVRRVFDDGSKSGSMVVYGVPPNTQLLKKRPLLGHWLEPDGRNTMFVNYDALDLLGADAMDKPIQLEMNGEKQPWQIVGVGVRLQQPIAQIRLEDYDRYFKNPPSVRTLAIQTLRTDRPSVEAVESDILALFKQRKWIVNATFIVDGTNGKNTITSVIYMLLGTALLVAAVGGLGLVNTLGLNILERTREIGILRSLGSRSYVIRQMVVTESLVICAISVLIGTPLSQPIGVITSNLLGQTVFGRDMPYIFPTDSFILWLVLISLVGLVASLSPAQVAIQLTVRDTLAYQ